MATHLSEGDTAVLIVVEEDDEWALDRELIAAGADPIARQSLDTLIKEVARAEMIAGDVANLDVTVQGEHDFKLKDSFTTRDDSGWLTGSVFGSAIGLIGGPLGVLFGGTLGALVGADSDVAQVASDQERPLNFFGDKTSRFDANLVSRYSCGIKYLGD
ncbi:hypothetical protein H7R52_02195 [Weissella confusa]|uniref:DUF1269 domain-containing protein n=1 Tax=Weissella confusa TaxID=1583 RepID=A0A923NH76_WEICO|nr:hypothetical protein [Weissella confusa]